MCSMRNGTYHDSVHPSIISVWTGLNIEHKPQSKLVANWGIQTRINQQGKQARKLQLKRTYIQKRGQSPTKKCMEYKVEPGCLARSLYL